MVQQSPARLFVQTAIDNGIDFFTGVPCSYLKAVFEDVAAKQLRYWPAPREDSACSTAVGAYLGGARPLVAMQNSGFGQSINAICSLVIPYRIPLVILVSWRGEPGKDAPEHDIMGDAFPKLLEALRLEWVSIRDYGARCAVEHACHAAYQTERPTVIVAQKGDF